MRSLIVLLTLFALAAIGSPPVSAQDTAGDITLSELVWARIRQTDACLSDDRTWVTTGGPIGVVRVPRYDLPEIGVWAWWTPGYTGEVAPLRPECMQWDPERIVEYAIADPYASRQWNLSRIEIEAAWLVTQGDIPGSLPPVPMQIAIIDTGLDCAHADGNCATGPVHYDAVTDSWLEPGEVRDVYGHGTFVGSLAAAPINGLGMYGVAPAARLRSYRACNSFGKCSSLHIARAIIRAWGRVDVINMSFGSSTRSSMVADAIAEAVASYDIVPVASVGNGGPSTRGLYPACEPDVIGVGSVDRIDRLADSSQRACVDIVAPGVNLIGARANGGWLIECGAVCSGTSYAAPHVAAVAALVRSVAPSASVAEVALWLYQSADRIGACGGAGAAYPNPMRCGYGRLNARRAVTLVVGIPTPSTAVPSVPTDTLTPVTTPTSTMHPDVAATLTAMAPTVPATATPTPTSVRGLVETPTSTPSPTGTPNARDIVATAVAGTLTAEAPPNVAGTVEAIMSATAAAVGTMTAEAPLDRRIAATVDARHTAEARRWLLARTRYLPIAIRQRPATATPDPRYPWHQTQTAEARQQTATHTPVPIPTPLPTRSPRPTRWAPPVLDTMQ